MSKFDLHIHTNHSSNSKLNINEILDNCSENNIDILSITDHDSCASFFDIDPIKTSFKGKIIYGMEANAMIGKVTYDILCYDFDLEMVMEWSSKTYPPGGHHQEIIFNALRDLCIKNSILFDESLPYDSVNEYAHGAMLRMLQTNPESIKFLESYGIYNVTDFYHIGTVEEKFPLFVDMHILWPDIEELKDVIHKAGGKIFLAHPFKCNRDVTEVLESCFPHVDGIEISNEPNSAEEVQMLYDFAKDKKLLVSAGNDYRGSKKHNELGVKYLTNEMEEDILSWVNNCQHYMTLPK